MAQKPVRSVQHSRPRRETLSPGSSVPVTLRKDPSAVCPLCLFVTRC